ncbi:MAG: DinB family protein [Ardenticatenaceae bacterium]|nr:DinB family protein [Ardenticatenaceae bacterium]
MNELLLDAFNHSAWAKKKLIAACDGLSVADMDRLAPGSVGSIRATLNHLVIADARYLARLDGGPTAWLDEAAVNDLGDLLKLSEESDERWQRFLREPIDRDRIVTLDDGAYETHANVVIVQALHHVSIHGEQVCASLTALGIEPPDVQPWEMADTTGRSRWLRHQEE